MYYGSGTVDRSDRGQPADSAAYASGGRYVCAHQMAALFCVQWYHGHNLESMKSHKMCIYLKNNLTKFHPDTIWNNRALRIFWRGCPNKNKNNENNKNKMSSNMRSVPDPTVHLVEATSWMNIGTTLSQKSISSVTID